VKNIFTKAFSEIKAVCSFICEKITYLQDHFQFFVQLIVEDVVASDGRRIHI